MNRNMDGRLKHASKPKIPLSRENNQPFTSFETKLVSSSRTRNYTLSFQSFPKSIVFVIRSFTK